MHIETHTTKLEDKALERRLCGYSMNSKAYRIYNPDARRVTESRNVIFETPVSTIIGPYTSNNNEAGNPQEDSSSSATTADISITDHDEVPRQLRKLLDLTTKDLNKSTSQESTPGNSTTPETPPSGADGSTPSPDTITTAQPTGSEQGGATRMRTPANDAIAPSHTKD